MDIKKQEEDKFWKDFAAMMGWEFSGVTEYGDGSFYTGEKRQFCQLAPSQAEDIIKVARGGHLPSCDFNCSCAWADPPEDE